MRLFSFLVTGLTLLSCARSQDLTPEVSADAEKHHYKVRLCLYRSRVLGRDLKCVIRVMSPVSVKLLLTGLFPLA